MSADMALTPCNAYISFARPPFSFALASLSSSFLSQTFVIYTSSVQPLENEDVLPERARETSSTSIKLSAQRCGSRCKLKSLSISSTSGINAIRNLSGRTGGCVVTRGLCVYTLRSWRAARKIAREPSNCWHVKRMFCGGPECPLARPDESYLSSMRNTKLFNLITRAQE